MYKYIKRLIDIILSLILLVLLIGIVVIVGIAVICDDGFPVFYGGERIGKDGKKFRMWKFRSMKNNSVDIRNEDGSTYNSADDKRVTKVGKFIRETSIDELPQVFNVLIGDMSFIGPRASLWESLNDYEVWELDKLKVRPGITGYTQSYFRNDISLKDKRKYDVWYSNNYNFMVDIKIIVKTINTLLRKRGIYTNVNMKTNG